MNYMQRRKKWCRDEKNKKNMCGKRVDACCESDIFLKFIENFDPVKLFLSFFIVNNTI